MALVFGLSPLILIFSYAQNNTNDQPDTSSSIPQSGTGGVAQSVIQKQMMTFGSNVRNILILIPNEGHESPTLPEEQRQINQPYVPQNIVVNPGTNIIWLNGDVGHEHTITLIDENSGKVYDSGKFDFNTVSKPLVLNKTGKFAYSEANVNVDDPKFVMKGTLTVRDTPPTSSNITSDTVGFFMVPTKDLDKHISELTDSGVQVLDKHTFKDLRGGQKGTGPDETLLFLGSKDLQNQLISTLQKIAPDLPYS